MGDVVRDITDATFGAELLFNTALTIPPAKYWGPIAAYVGGAAGGPVGANLGEVKGLPFPS